MKIWCYQCKSFIILPIRMITNLEIPISCCACVAENRRLDPIHSRSYRSRKKGWYYSSPLRMLIEDEEEQRIKFIAMRIREYYDSKNL